jgi:sugar (pentulose or hexulose) kinase
MAATVGIAANASMVSAQLLRVRETWPQEVWARTGRVQLASAFLASLVAGKWTSMGESEACGTGAWVHGASHNAAGHWNEDVLDIVGGSKEEGRRVRGWLGDVDVSGGSRRAGSVSRYLVERYGFDPGRFDTQFPFFLVNLFHRHYCCALFIRSSVFISFSIAFTQRCSPLFWAYGYVTHTSTTLYSYSSL